MTAGRLAILLAALAVCPTSVDAGTWRVGRQPTDCPGGCNFHDGNSGDPGFGIQAAMASIQVLPGDTVLVYPDNGEPYPATIRMKSGVVLISAQGADNTEISGGAGSEPCLFLLATDPNTEIRGFTISWAASGEAVGGGIGAWVSKGRIRDNVFRSNTAGLGAAVYMQASDMILENNLFVANSAISGGGAVAASGGSPTIRGNTFTGNSAPFGFEGAAVYATSSALEVSRNIVHGSLGAAALFCGTGNTPSITCNLFWDNALGAFGGSCVDSVGTSGNIADDPRFCDVGLENFGLCADSPALSAPCGPIGYVSPGGNCAACGPPPSSLAASTWGQIKALYR